jgi:hypothetical protein
MRHAILLVPGFFLLLATAMTSCGGSSSETPWPVEPEASQLGPTAEGTTPPSLITDHLDGGYRRRGQQ